MEKEIIIKIKKILQQTILELEQSYKDANLFLEIKNKLENIDNIDVLLELDLEDLIEILNKIEVNYDLDTLKTSIYFYDCGKQYSNFKGTLRYNKAYEILYNLLSEIKTYFSKENISQNIDILDSQKSKTSDLLKWIETGVFEEKFLSLDDYEFIFDYNKTLSDEEKIEFYTALIQNYSCYLISIEEKMKESLILEEETKLEEKSKNLFNDTFLETGIIEESSQDISIPTESVIAVEETVVELTGEQQQQVENIELERKKRISLINNISEVKVDLFKNLMQSLSSNENSLEVIKSSMSLTDFKLFMIFMLDKSVDDILFALNEEYPIRELGEAKDMIFMDVSLCEEYIDMILEIEKEQDTLDVETDIALSEEKSMGLIFYETQSGIAEFEKNIKDFSGEKLESCRQLIEQLQDGRIGAGKAIAGGTESPTMYEIHKGNVFVTFRIMPNNHILVYHVSPLENLNKQKTNSKLASLSAFQLKHIKNIIIDEGIEYRKLMTRNLETLARIKEKCTSNKEYK